MDRFARNDPQTLAGLKPFMLQQPRPPFFTGIRLIDRPAQDGIAGLIPHL